MKATVEEALATLRVVNATSIMNAAAVNVLGFLQRGWIPTMPVTWDVVVTKACNLRCIFCISYDSLKDTKWLDFSLYERWAEIALPRAMNVLFCSGGEPLLYPRIRDALRLAKESNTRATMTTNAMLLDADVAEWMVGDQSLNELCISFDGGTPETLERIRVGASYDVIVGNLERLAALKKQRGAFFPRMWFRFAIMRSNAEELPNVIDLAARLGLYKVEVKYLNVANDIDVNESLYFHPELAARVFSEAAGRAKKHGVHLKAPKLPGEQSRGRRCLQPWQFCQMDTDGSLRICYYCWRQRVGFFDDGFESVWRGEHYQKIRTTMESGAPYYPYCAHCPVRLGPNRQSAHAKDAHEEAMVIPGLEHLSTGFNERIQENVKSFKQMKK